MWQRTRCVQQWGGGPLEGQTYVDECTDGLHACFVLCVIEKIALAALVGWMPIEDIELGAG